MKGKKEQIEKTKEALGSILDNIEDVNSLFLVASVGKMSVNMLVGSIPQNISAVLNLKQQCPDAFNLFSEVWKIAIDIDMPNEKNIIDQLRKHCDTPLKFTMVKHRIIESFMEAEVPLPPSISEAVNVDELSLSVEGNKAIFRMMVSELKNKN